MVVDAKSVPGCVGVCEHSRLQHGVWTGFDSGDHVAWAEGGLFDLREPVVGVAVELYSACLAEWIKAMWPHFGHVEYVDGCGGDLIGANSLHADVP